MNFCFKIWQTWYFLWNGFFIKCIFLLILSIWILYKAKSLSFIDKYLLFYSFINQYQFVYGNFFFRICYLVLQQNLMCLLYLISLELSQKILLSELFMLVSFDFAVYILFLYALLLQSFFCLEMIFKDQNQHHGLHSSSVYC